MGELDLIEKLNGVSKWLRDGDMPTIAAHVNDARNEIIRLTERLAAAEAALAELEQSYSDLESERNKINRERAAAEARCKELESRPIKMMDEIIEEFYSGGNGHEKQSHTG